MESPIVVKFAHSRYRLIDTLADWSDSDFQRRQWIGHQYEEIAFALPYYDTDTLYDDTGVFPVASDALGDTLGSKLEASRVQAIADVYDPFEAGEWIDWDDYNSFLSHPTWPNIVRLCRRALTVLALGGGTMDFDEGAVRPDQVSSPQSRNTVAHALASIAEATYRQPGEYTDEDAPAYLVSPEQAIDTLLTTGHLDNPRSQIGVIYRDSYEEIPRLEALHDSVIRYQSGEIALADLADPAVDALCSIIRSGAGWDLNPDELAAVRQRATES